MRQFAARVQCGLTKVFTLLPTSNYQSFISRSHGEIAAKAWGRTGDQMRKAVSYARNIRARFGF